MLIGSVAAARRLITGPVPGYIGLGAYGGNVTSGATMSFTADIESDMTLWFMCVGTNSNVDNGLTVGGNAASLLDYSGLLASTMHGALYSISGVTLPVGDDLLVERSGTQAYGLMHGWITRGMSLQALDWKGPSGTGTTQAVHTFADVYPGDFIGVASRGYGTTSGDYGWNSVVEGGTFWAAGYSDIFASYDSSYSAYNNVTPAQPRKISLGIHWTPT